MSERSEVKINLKNKETVYLTLRPFLFIYDTLLSLLRPVVLSLRVNLVEIWEVEERVQLFCCSYTVLLFGLHQENNHSKQHPAEKPVITLDVLSENTHL